MNRVTDPADPRRCQFTFENEQCWNQAPDGSGNCLAHGGRDRSLIEGPRLYRLNEARLRNRLAQFSEHEHVKSLREEIGLARIMAEEYANSIKTDTDLLARCGMLNTLMLTIERLVKSAHAIDKDLGVLLSKQSVFRLGQLMCEIVAQELEHVEGREEIIDRIHDRLVQAISKANNDEEAQKLLPAPT